MFSSSRTVLFMTDEALQIYKTTARAVGLVATVPWDEDGFERRVAQIIAQDCKKAPVLIINDMVEQHYRKERVLTSGVSILDRKAMVNRKLNMAFPNYPLRAALPLKEKIKNEGGKMSSDIFIFAAVPNTSQFSKTVSAMNLSLATSKGICLLPVEVADMAKTLAKKFQTKKGLPPRWVVLMGQHKSGGLRQVVIKDGEVALTRMSPIGDYREVDTWSDDVIQEFNATMSYLTRFGFQAEEGLEVIMLSDSDAAAAVANKIDPRFDFKTTTPKEAGKMLRVNAAIAKDDNYADELHIGWIVKKTALTLPMRAQTLEDVAKPRQIANAAMVVMTLSALFFAYEGILKFAKSAELSEDIDLKMSRLNQVREDYEIEVKKKEALGFDVRLIQSSVSVYKDLKDKTVNMAPFINKLSQALEGNLSLDALTIKSLVVDAVGDEASTNPFGRAAKKLDYLEQATLQLSYPSDADIDKGNKEIEALSKRLQGLFNEYEVEVTKRLKDFNYVETITVGGDQNDAADVAQDFIAEITMKRRNNND